MLFLGKSTPHVLVKDLLDVGAERAAVLLGHRSSLAFSASLILILSCASRAISLARRLASCDSVLQKNTL
jgi:hypothetical protein